MVEGGSGALQILTSIPRLERLDLRIQGGKNCSRIERGLSSGTGIEESLRHVNS